MKTNIIRYAKLTNEVTKYAHLSNRLSRCFKLIQTYQKIQ